MAEPQRILVVVDPTASSQPAVACGARLARALGWDLELLSCTHSSLAGPAPAAAGHRDPRRALLDRQLTFLKELAGGWADLKVAVRAVWDRPLHEAIIRQTLRSEPRLVMKDSHYHSIISRALLTNTDWHLIRDCPAPLWLVRRAVPAAAPVIAACVDPGHEHDRPADLDERILREAAFFAAALGGAAHVAHCLDDTALLAAAGVDGAGSGERAAELRAERASRLGDLAARHGIARGCVGLHSGPPADAIPAAADRLGADLVVMGAVARSRLQQLMVGSTAEHVLDRLSCDVLVVKPARFESPVTYRAQAGDFMELH